jgi:hypothetical protein
MVNILTVEGDSRETGRTYGHMSSETGRVSCETGIFSTQCDTTAKQGVLLRAETERKHWRDKGDGGNMESPGYFLTCPCQFRMLVMGAGILPPKPVNVDEHSIFLTSTIWASPNSPPKTALSPTSLPGTGMRRTAVVL